MDSGNAPYVSHATSFPSQLLSTFASLPPSSISTLIRMLHKRMTRYHYSALPGYTLPQKKITKKKLTPTDDLLRDCMLDSRKNRV